MREIVLDTETTGLSPTQGHRVIEIGCVELFQGIITGKTFHCYINPEIEVPENAFRVHGLNYDFLQKFPLFHAQSADFLQFIENSPLIIHNAKFDMGFLNYELEAIGKRSLTNSVIDTLLLARQKFPGSAASLDALCKRFNISLSNRSLHGALIDAHLLSKVYIELTGGAQCSLYYTDQTQSEKSKNLMKKTQHVIRKARIFPISSEEEKKHLELLKNLHIPAWNLKNF